MKVTFELVMLNSPNSAISYGTLKRKVRSYKR